MSEKSATLEDILSEIVKTREDLNTQIVQVRSDIKSSLEASEARILFKTENLKERIKELEKENLGLRDQVEVLERNQKKNTILIFGLNKPVEERSISLFCDEIGNLLDIQISEADIKDFYSLGKLPESPLKVELLTNHKKRLILQNTKKLKNTGWIIANDLTELQRNNIKYLRERMNCYRETNSEKCYIRGEKLFIGNKGYSVDELEDFETTANTTSHSAPATPTPENLPDASVTRELDKVQENDSYKNPNLAQGPGSKNNKKIQQLPKTNLKVLSNIKGSPTTKNTTSKPVDIREKLRNRNGSTNK